MSTVTTMITMTKMVNIMMITMKMMEHSSRLRGRTQAPTRNCTIELRCAGPACQDNCCSLQMLVVLKIQKGEHDADDDQKLHDRAAPCQSCWSLQLLVLFIVNVSGRENIEKEKPSNRTG